ALRNRARQNALAKGLASGSMDYEDYYYNSYPYVRDLYDDYVVYSMNGSELYQSEYTMNSDGGVELGDEIPVQVSYVPTGNVEESKDLTIEGELIELKERAVNDNGIAQIKLISPGWGSSGYYSEKVLKRDGPKVFKKGL